MSIFVSVPAVLSFLVLASHFLRDGSVTLAVGCLAMVALVLARDRRIIRLVQLVLLLAAAEWVFTTYDIVQQRQAEHREWLRAAVILLGVAAFNLSAAALLRLRTRF